MDRKPCLLIPLRILHVVLCFPKPTWNLNYGNGTYVRSIFHCTVILGYCSWVNITLVKGFTELNYEHILPCFPRYIFYIEVFSATLNNSIFSIVILFNLILHIYRDLKLYTASTPLNQLWLNGLLAWIMEDI